MCLIPLILAATAREHIAPGTNMHTLIGILQLAAHSGNVSHAITFVRSQIRSNGCIVFGKSYCPFTIRAKNLLLHVGARCAVVDLDQVNRGSTSALLQAALYDVSAQHTLPNVFVGQKHIGGADDTEKLYSSEKLIPLLIRAKSYMNLSRNLCSGQKRHVAVRQQKTAHISRRAHLYEQYVRLLSHLFLKTLPVKGELEAIHSKCRPRSVNVKNSLLAVGARCEVVDLDQEWRNFPTEHLRLKWDTQSEDGPQYNQADDDDDSERIVPYSSSSFGPQLPLQDDMIALSQPLGGNLVAALPANGCLPLSSAVSQALRVRGIKQNNMLNFTEYKNSVVLIKRGGCPFSHKVMQAQNAGATAVVVFDNIPPKHGHSLVKMAGGDAEGKSIHIPSVFVSLAAGQKLLSLLHESVQRSTSKTRPRSGKLQVQFISRRGGGLASAVRVVTGMDSVPNLCLNGHTIGGESTVSKLLLADQLAPLLAQAHAYMWRPKGESEGSYTVGCAQNPNELLSHQHHDVYQPYARDRRSSLVKVRAKPGNFSVLQQKTKRQGQHMSPRRSTRPTLMPSGVPTRLEFHHVYVQPASVPAPPLHARAPSPSPYTRAIATPKAPVSAQMRKDQHNQELAHRLFSENSSQQFSETISAGSVDQVSLVVGAIVLVSMTLAIGVWVGMRIERRQLHISNQQKYVKLASQANVDWETNDQSSELIEMMDTPVSIADEDEEEQEHGNK